MLLSSIFIEVFLLLVDSCTHTDGSRDARGIPSKLWAKLSRRLQKKKRIFTFVKCTFVCILF